MNIDFKQMVIMGNLLAEEKNLDPKLVHEIIEQAVAAAWRRDFGHPDQQVRSSINVHKGQVDIYIIYDVVEEVENEQNQISLKDALEKNPKIEIGGQVEDHQVMKQLGRVAAQSAKQVILQKLRQVERERILVEFESKVNTIMPAVVTRVDSRLIRLEIGRARGIMPLSEQIRGEHYYIGQRLKVLLKEIERTDRDPQLILSRGSTEFLHLLFKKEVPEMENNAVEIKKIVREPGVRAKIAVTSNVPNVDPVGTLVGGHGARVKSVNNEIGDQEKIDIIVWDEDDREYIINALNPTKVIDVVLTPSTDDSPNKALVVVANGQLNIAIGRNGQNVRLAGKLAGYEIDVVDEAAHRSKTEHRLVKKEKLEENLLETIQSSSEEDDQTEPNQEIDQPTEDQPDQESEADQEVKLEEVETESDQTNNEQTTDEQPDQEVQTEADETKPNQTTNEEEDNQSDQKTE